MHSSPYLQPAWFLFFVIVFCGVRSVPPN
uniref:Uncharacterized protein n=1 Tax=Anguilla anguilla TaxID=7936 RepID=A0A0E9SK68_ANGAN